MSHKKFGMFQLIGTVVGHPALGDARRGDTLKLEVGDDGRPTSELLASRTKPVGKLITVDEDNSEAVAKVAGMLEDAKVEANGVREAANAEAAELMKAARVEAAKILEDAKVEANGVREAANAEAAELMKAAGGGKK